MNQTLTPSAPGARTITRLGKIARLPLAIRAELNHRLDDGEVGKRLVEWLNALPEVQAVLAAEFGGRAISVQNLSEWKHGGYEDWQRRSEARAWVKMLSDEGTAAGETWDPRDLGGELAMFALVRMGQLLQNLPAEMSGPEECKRLLEAMRELTQLRRANAAVERAEAATARIDLEYHRIDLEREREEEAEIKDMEEKIREVKGRTARMKAFTDFMERGREEDRRKASEKEPNHENPTPEPTEAIRPNPTGSNRENSGDWTEEEGPTNIRNKTKERQEKENAS